MKLEEKKEVETQETRKGNEAQSPSRRKFLRTSSTTALVTSLAAQPVWGQTCSASAGSAASQVQCDVTSIPNVSGRSTDFWSQAWTQPLEETVTSSEPITETTRRGAPPGSSTSTTSSYTTVTSTVAADLSLYLSAFPSVSQTDAEALLLYIKDVMASNMFTIPGTSTQTPQVYNVADAINGWGSSRNLAAIWLNAYFEHFDIAPPGRPNTPQDWVEHFHALYELSGGGGMVFDAVLNNFATTAWTLPVYVQETETIDPDPVEETTTTYRRGAPPV